MATAQADDDTEIRGGIFSFAAVAAVCVLPGLLQLLGVGLETGFVDYKTDFVDAITDASIDEVDFGLVQGATWYTMLEWTSVLLAMATAALAYMHFVAKRHILSILVLAITFWVGAMTAFQLLAFYGFSTHVQILGAFVHVNWTIAQTSMALLLLATAAAVVWRPHGARRLDRRHVLTALIAISVGAYAIVFATARAPSLPAWTTPDHWVNRPLDLVALALFALAAFVALPAVHRRCGTPFSAGLWMASIPLVASQLYMAFGSRVVFDAGFTAAQLMKTLAVGTVFCGLAIDYARACRQESTLIRRLSDHHRRLQMLFDNAVEGIIVFDERGIVQRWNRRAAQFFDLPEAHETQHDVLDLLFGVDDETASGERDRLCRLLTQAPESPEARRQLKKLSEWTLADEDKEQRTIEYSVVSAWSDDEIVFALLARDVTRSRRLQRQMTQMDRLVSMGTLAAGIVHELKNPLTYVISNTYVAREAIADLRRASSRGPRDDQTAERLDDIHAALEAADEGVERIHQIIDDMRQFSRVHADDQTIVDVEHTLRVALRMTRGQLQRTLSLDVDIDDVAPVEANETRLSQVFVNLMTNAAEAVDDDGGDDGRLRVELTRDDQEVVIRFTDNGPGIDEQMQRRIFQPFFTTKSPERGTGLGLSLSKSIVEDFGGELSVESTVGEQTTFEIRLPAVSTLPENDPRPSPPNTSFP